MATCIAMLAAAMVWNEQLLHLTWELLSDQWQGNIHNANVSIFSSKWFSAQRVNHTEGSWSKALGPHQVHFWGPQVNFGGNKLQFLPFFLTGWCQFGPQINFNKGPIGHSGVWGHKALGLWEPCKYTPRSSCLQQMLVGAMMPVLPVWHGKEW